MIKSRYTLMDEVGNEINSIEFNENERLIFRKENINQTTSYRRKKEDINLLKSEIDDNFFHLIYNYKLAIFDDIRKVSEKKADTHIIRFIMLCTYMNFRNKLVDDNRKSIKKTDLKKIWNTSSKNSINETYNILIELRYINVDEDGIISVNKDVAQKGKINKKMNETYTRVFNETMKNLLKNIGAREQKKLANLFKILPFINYKYNILCLNPEETDKDKIKVLNWKDVANLCDYSESQSSRLRKDMMSIKLDNKHMIGEFTIESGQAIVISPKIYYAGSDVNDVKWLYAMFSILEK